MTKKEIQHYFGVKDHFEIPEYDVATPLETEPNGRAVSHFRRRRSHTHPEVLHYRLHAFGERLRLRMKRNKRLMAPNLVIETHHGGGLVTARPVPENKFYLGKVFSDPDSLVALKSNKGLTGMIKTSGDILFVQPLPRHLAKRVRKSAITVPHLIYKLSTGKRSESDCQTKEPEKGRFETSIRRRTPRAANESTHFRYLEAALIVSQQYVEKYQSDKFATILLVIANMVAAMFQDPSIGKYPVYYVVNKIFHIKNTTELGFKETDPISVKLNRISGWSNKYMSKSDADPEHFDVFSYITDKMSGGLAQLSTMCKPGNGNMNGDMGLQTALTVAHETGHNFNLGHDGQGCHGGPFIMSSITPSGKNAAKWSNCSRVKLESLLKSKTRWTCLNDVPFEIRKLRLDPNDQNRLPGEIFDGNQQCEMQYGKSWTLSPHRKGDCSKLFCFKGGAELSEVAPMADGSPCGARDWCIGGVCEDNGKKRRPGGWSSWSLSYSKCTRSCGGGAQYSRRYCNNPTPMNDGKPCEGSYKFWRICNPQLCPLGSATFRAGQCTQRRPGSRPIYWGHACSLFCAIGRVVRGTGYVEDGTRCYSDKKRLDVCIERQCRRVGCDHILDSNALVDRCGICGGNGDSCFKVEGFYNKSHTITGPENADLIAKIVVGTTGALFQIKKVTQNYLGLQWENGTYLVGGHFSSRVQTVTAAGTTIKYNKNNRKPRLLFAGPTNAILKVVYIFRSGSNLGVDYSFTRPSQAGDPKVQYQWKTAAWSSCSVTCGRGVRKRSVRCVTFGDQTPASDQACDGRNKPAVLEQCSPTNCAVRWQTTPWSDCSKSCGNGKQTRKVECVMDITPTEYLQSDNCSDANKPNVPITLKSCNSFACFSDWDTKEGLNRDDCGEPIDPNTLSCYRIDERGRKSMVPPIMCRYRPRPTRLPCTTPSSPTQSRPSTPRPPYSKSTVKAGSQKIQTNFSLLITLLALLLHLTKATTY